MIRVSLADLAGGAAQAPPLDDAGRPVDPVLIVDLDGPADPALLRAAREAAVAADRILIGVRTREGPHEAWAALLASLDVTLATRVAWPNPLPSRHATPPPAPAESVDVVPSRSPSDSPVQGVDATRFWVVAGDPWAEAEVLHAAVAAHPQAAAVLAQVLRASEGLDVRRALDVESFAYSTLLGGAEFRAWLAARGSRPLPPPAGGPPVLLERTGDRLRITLNRPERRNAYGRELRDALVEALRVAALDDGIGAVTLAGAAPVFCSGGDLDEFGTTPDLATAHFVRTRGGAGELLHRIAGRTEARLHGTCVGAGIELAAFAGRVVAGAGTTVRLPEVGMGLIPGAGGTVSIPRRIGRWRTFHLALTGRDLDAATAARWGLVDESA